MTPDVTVCVPVYNAARTIARLLEGLGRQATERPFEVVLVDDGSTDATPALLASLPSGVRAVRQVNAGPAAARNRAAREGRGAALLFTDSDCVPRPDWLERSMACLEAHPEAVAVGGSYDIANPGSRLARLIHAEIMWRHASLGTYVRFAGSYNFAVRRQAFEAVGGFSTRYRNASAEDNDLSYRLLGLGRIVFCAESLVAHHHTERLGKYLKEQYLHGRWRAMLYREHPAMARGDDYTRWTDVADVPLSLGSLAAALLWPLSGGLGWAVLLGLGTLVGLKSVQGVQVSCYGAGAGAAGFAAVAAARAFARSLGFAAGLTGISRGRA
ncbi:MAG: glycosyltransferase [Deltaproteobacteria bacterium]|nr:glycosyltransferase [Deltaproteobacteria bacterium]